MALNRQGTEKPSYDSVAISQKCLVLSWQCWLFETGMFGCCTMASSHSMLYNLVSISSHSLQLDLSMLTLKLVTLVVKMMKNHQYKMDGACWKGFYDAHQVLKLYDRIHQSLFSGGAWILSAIQGLQVLHYRPGVLV